GCLRFPCRRRDRHRAAATVPRVPTPARIGSGSGRYERHSVTTLFIRHRVSDYPAWRKVYDAVADMQQRLGVTAKAVYQSEDDPSDITVTHEFANIASARAFVHDPELKAAMNNGGFLATPTFRFTTR